SAGGGSAFVGRIAALARLVSLPRISSSLGNAATPTDPTFSSGRYSNALMALSESLGDCGSGPLGFGPVPRPLALSQISRLPAIATALGYSAVGMRRAE